SFSRDSRLLVTAGADRTARIWDVPTGRPVGSVLAHQGPVYRAVFSADGRTVLTGCDDNTGRLWDLATGRPLGEPLRHRYPVGIVAFAPEGKTVATGSADATACLWKVPAPLAGSVKRLALWSQVVTGMELSSGEVVRPLDAHTWQERRRRLE